MILRLGPGDVFAERYQLVERIGQGGMGTLWRAHQFSLQRDVALKFVTPLAASDPQFRQMFQNEAMLAARVQHPNVVPILDFGEYQELLYIVQLFVPGWDLGKIIQGRALPVPEALYVATQILSGLQAAHERRVLHRDLKPANILVSPEATVQIVDFGIAKTASSGTPSMSTTIKGSPPYMAPEMWQGRPARFASDLFAVGVMLVEMVTGENPFFVAGGGDRDAISRAICQLELPALSAMGAAVPSGLDDLAARLLMKDPEARYQSAANALEDMVAVAAPLARDATSVALRRHLRTTMPTVVEPAPTPLPPALPGTVRTGSMAGQAVQALPTVTQRKRRGRGAAMAVAGLTATIAAVAIAWISRSGGGGEIRPAQSPPAPAEVIATPDAGPPAAPDAPVAPPDAAPPPPAAVEPEEKPTRPKTGTRRGVKKPPERPVEPEKPKPPPTEKDNKEKDKDGTLPI